MLTRASSVSQCFYEVIKSLLIAGIMHARLLSGLLVMTKLFAMIKDREATAGLLRGAFPGPLRHPMILEPLRSGQGGPSPQATPVYSTGSSMFLSTTQRKPSDEGRKTGLTKILLLGATVSLSHISPACAQNECFRPTRPNVSTYVSNGETADLQIAFEAYFKETTEYLNCSNAVSTEVMKEAQEASQEYRNILQSYKTKPVYTMDEANKDEDEDFNNKYDPYSKDDGRLFLDPQPTS